MMLIQLLLYSCLVVYSAQADTGTKEKGCSLSKTTRSDQPKQASSKVVHLLADLDRLSKGIKRSVEESDCPDDGSNKKDVIQIKQAAASSIPKSSKLDEVVDEKEPAVSKKTKIDSDKTVKLNAFIKKASETPSTKQDSTLKNTPIVAKEENSTKKHKLPLVKAKETVALSKIIKESAESSIPAKTKDVTGDKKQAVAKKPNGNEIKNSPLWNLSKLLDEAQKPSAAGQKKNNVTDTTGEKRGTQYHPSIVPSDASVALKNTTSVTASAAASLVANPDKLTPKAAETEKAEQKGKVADAKPAASSDSKASGASTKSAATPSSTTGKASSSSTDTSKAAAPATTTSTAKTSSDKGAAPAAAAAPAKAKPAPDPYAEIAEGPDKPKLPELKTGDDGGGAPLMRLGDNGGVQQMADSGGAHMKGGKPLEGQHDVGGLLDSLTDKLNAGAGGVATEQVLPDGEAKFLQNQAGAMDDEAQRQADQWKGLDKLKDLADQADEGKDPNKLAEAEGLLPKEAPDPQEAASAAPSLPMPEDSQSRQEMATSSSQSDDTGAASSASSAGGMGGMSAGLTKEMLSKFADSETSLEKQLGSSAGAIAALKGGKDGEEDDEYAGADVTPGPDPYSQPEPSDETGTTESIGRASSMLPHLAGGGNFESTDGSIGDSVSNIPGGAEYLHDTGLDRTGISNLPQEYDSEATDPGSQVAGNVPQYQPEEVSSEGRQSYLDAAMGALTPGSRDDSAEYARHHIPGPGRMYASNRRLRSYMYPHMRNYNNYMSGEMYRRDSILKPGDINEYSLTFT